MNQRTCQVCGAPVRAVPFRDVCGWACYWRLEGCEPKPVIASPSGMAHYHKARDRRIQPDLFEEEKSARPAVAGEE